MQIRRGGDEEGDGDEDAEKMKKEMRRGGIMGIK